MFDSEVLHVSTREAMERAIEHLQLEMAKIRTGKAASNMLDGLMVVYYGTPTPINQVANISVADARTVSVQPWDRGAISAIERALLEANLGITPQNDGQTIRLMIPPLTEERRRELVKKAKHIGEESKVGVRSARRDAIESIKKAVKDGLPEDMGKRLEAEIEGLTKSFIEKTDKMVEAKEKDIMTV
jgi:ribosome recycling factor